MPNSEKFARFVLFTIYIWFGLLKIWGTSPANPLVEALLSRTLPFVSFPTFMLFLGTFEVIIGLLFLIPLWTRATKIIFAIHMAVVFLPLIFLPAIAWQGTFVPTLEGQYILKNLALIALVAGL